MAKKKQEELLYVWDSDGGFYRPVAPNDKVYYDEKDIIRTIPKNNTVNKANLYIKGKDYFTEPKVNKTSKTNKQDKDLVSLKDLNLLKRNIENSDLTKIVKELNEILNKISNEEIQQKSKKALDTLKELQKVKNKKVLPDNPKYNELKKEKLLLNTKLVNELTSIQDYIDNLTDKIEGIEHRINSSKYISKKSKRSYESVLNHIEKKEDLQKLEKIITKESLSSELLIKMLSSIKQDIEAKKEDFEKEGIDYQKEYLSKIDEIAINYQKTGLLDTSEIKKIIKSLDESSVDVNIRVDIKDSLRKLEESTYIKTIQNLLSEQVDIFTKTLSKDEEKKIEPIKKEYQAGSLSFKDFTKKVSEVGINIERLSKVIDSLSESNRLKDNLIQSYMEKIKDNFSSEKDKKELFYLEELYRQNKITTEEITNQIKALSKGLDNKSQSKVEEYLYELKTTNEVLVENSKETNLDKIAEQNKLEREEKLIETLEDATNSLKDIKADRNIMGKVLGSSSAEELGENLTDTVLDQIGDALDLDFLRDEDNPNKGKRRKGRRTTRGKSKGRFKSLKNITKRFGKKGKFLSKLGVVSKIPTVAKGAGLISAGVGLYNYTTAENEEEQKDAIGSTVGSFIGGGLGTFFGPAGTVIGASLGSMAGSYVSGLFTDIDDYIPNDIKEKGVIDELMYIDEVLEPQVEQSIQNKDGSFEKDDLDELRKYRKELESEKLPNYLKSLVNKQNNYQDDKVKARGLLKKLSNIPDKKLYTEIASILDKEYKLSKKTDSKNNIKVKSPKMSVVASYALGEDKELTKEQKEEAQKGNNTDILPKIKDEEQKKESKSWFSSAVDSIKSFFGIGDDKPITTSMDSKSTMTPQEMAKYAPSSRITLPSTSNYGFNTKQLISDLRRDEGVILHKYKDHLGYDTIGVGHLIDKRAGIPLRYIIGEDKNRITSSEADFILQYDINRTAKSLYSRLPWLKQQPENIQRDLLNMAFNMGVPGLLGFKNTLKKIKEGKYTEASYGLQDSLWYKQVGKRAKRIVADVYYTGLRLANKKKNTTNVKEPNVAIVKAGEKTEANKVNTPINTKVANQDNNWILPKDKDSSKVSDSVDIPESKTRIIDGLLEQGISNPVTLSLGADVSVEQVNKYLENRGKVKSSKYETTGDKVITAKNNEDKSSSKDKVDSSNNTVVNNTTVFTSSGDDFRISNHGLEIMANVI